MKIQQLRYITAIADHGLNVTAAASSLHTSQPGVSKQVRLLEDELAVRIFDRSGKHLVAVTDVGQRIIDEARLLLQQAENIKDIARDDRDDSTGAITLATTHTQARYALPKTIQQFRQKYPKVALHIQQGSPPQIAEWAARGEVDFAIATEAMELFDDLVMMPCYRWNRAVLVQPDHPLTKLKRLSIEAIAEHPIITYVFGFTGRSKLDDAFNAAGLTADVVLTAVDADVIKTYVRLGLGIGIVANMAYDSKQDSDLVALDASHLFSASMTRIGVRRGTYLRAYMYDFFELFAPQLNRRTVDSLINAHSSEELRRKIAQLDAALPEY